MIKRVIPFWRQSYLYGENLPNLKRIIPLLDKPVPVKDNHSTIQRLISFHFEKEHSMQKNNRPILERIIPLYRESSPCEDNYPTIRRIIPT